MPPHNANAQVQKQQYASADDWERVKPRLKQLYIDENRILKEVMAIMASQHGHRGTKKMYVGRFEKWGWVKNKKEADMLFILRKNKQREALGKRTSFAVRGKVISYEEVVDYFKRKEGSPALEEPRSYILPQTPLHISYRTPSPSPSPDYPDNENFGVLAWFSIETDQNLRKVAYLANNCWSGEVPQRFAAPNGTSTSYSSVDGIRYALFPTPQIPSPLSPPQALRDPEELLFNISSYVDGSLGNWSMVDGRLGSGNSDRENVFNFQADCIIATELLQKSLFVEARRMLSSACSRISTILQAEDIRTLDFLLYAFLVIKQRGFELVLAIIRNHIRELALILPANKIFWKRIWILLDAIDMVQFEHMAVRAWQCAYDVCSRQLGGNFSAMDVSCYLDYINLGYWFNRRDQELILCEFLSEYKEDADDFHLLPCKSLVRIGFNLYHQKRFVELEVLATNLISRAQAEGSSGDEIWGFELAAVAQYNLDKTWLAESHMRIAIDMRIETSSKACAIENLCQFESWLRGWGRGADADEVNAELKSLIEPDDVDKEKGVH